MIDAYLKIRPNLLEKYPEIKPLLPNEISVSKTVQDGYLRSDIVSIANEITLVLETWSRENTQSITSSSAPRRIFISHGRSEIWRKVQEYIEKVLSVATLELAQELNAGRTIFQKLIDSSESCSYAVIIMTGDDESASEVRARENVIHEIGYFQGKYGAEKVCILHEEGVNIPSNIQGIVYIPFPKDYIDAAFGGLTREIKHLLP